MTATPDKLAGAPVEVEVLPAARGDAKGDAKGGAKEVQRDDATKPPRAASEAPKAESTKPEADKDRPRFVVQAGAYTDAAAVREVRGKLERMGLKTYTQEVVVDGTPRVRVRVGPFSSKQEAQEVQNKIKAAGVAASLLTL
jgi:DedD protein